MKTRKRRSAAEREFGLPSEPDPCGPVARLLAEQAKATPAQLALRNLQMAQELIRAAAMMIDLPIEPAYTLEAKLEQRAALDALESRR